MKTKKVKCNLCLVGNVSPHHRYIQHGSKKTAISSWIECDKCKGIGTYVESEWKEKKK